MTTQKFPFLTKVVYSERPHMHFFIYTWNKEKNTYTLMQQNTWAPVDIKNVPESQLTLEE